MSNIYLRINIAKSEFLISALPLTQICSVHSLLLRQWQFHLKGTLTPLLLLHPKDNPSANPGPWVECGSRILPFLIFQCHHGFRPPPCRNVPIATWEVFMLLFSATYSVFSSPLQHHITPLLRSSSDCPCHSKSPRLNDCLHYLAPQPLWPAPPWLYHLVPCHQLSPACFTSNLPAMLHSKAFSWAFSQSEMLFPWIPTWHNLSISPLKYHLFSRVDSSHSIKKLQSTFSLVLRIPVMALIFSIVHTTN